MQKTVLLLICFLLSLPARADNPPTVARLENKLELGDLLIIGEAELIELPALDALWRGRIDSGATTTSLHAIEIENFERDGKPWVRFKARNEALDTEIDLERQVVRVAEIRRRGGEETQSRPVVMMEISIGGVSQMAEINLTDRTNFDFPVLIGRNVLSGKMLIDVSRAYLHGPAEGEK